MGCMGRVRFFSVTVAFGCLSAQLAGPSAAGLGEIPHFLDVTEEAGIRFQHLSGGKTEKRYLFEAKGGGIGFFDYDNDGWQDLLIVQGSTMERMRTGTNPVSAVLYRNRRDGSFEDVTAVSGLTGTGWGMGVAVGDYDNDGFADVYITQLTANILYRNRGDGTFRDVTEPAGVAGSKWTASAAFGDYDNDGYLDLYLANYVDMDLDNPIEPGEEPFCQYRGRPDMCGPMGLRAAANILYRNQGDGTFGDVTKKSGVDEGNHFYSLGVVWADLNGDGHIDLLVSNDSTPNNFYLNKGDGTFIDVGLLSGLAASADGGFQAGMGVDAADFDNDGRLDVFMTHFANDYSTLYRNTGDLLFEDVSVKANLLGTEWLLVSWSTRFVDLNHDGWKDLFHTNGHVYPFLLTAGWSESYYQPSTVYLNQRDGTFLDVTAQSRDAARADGAGRGAAFGDFDNDGDIDIAIARLNDSPQLLSNDLATSNHWVMFDLRGRQSNRDGLGARLEIAAGGLSQVWEVKRSVGIYSSSDPRAHFGLGSSDRVERLRVRWPSGRTQEIEDIAANRHYVLDEREGLSEAAYSPRRSP
jgi:enediyne biosynthesis protein E4